ncbi:hypothetical protein NE865_09536 [Phthorimaea operculella]|nr:hypothetical protein NE865_09536 [Phthorimaea operculella]
MTNYFGSLQLFDYKSSDWAIFKGRLTQFLKINKLTTDEDKSAILITHLSDESYRLLKNLAYPLTYVKLVELLDKHFKTKECSYADRANFYGATKSPGESLKDWVARLRGLATLCDFGTALETNLTDRFVLGLGSGPERDKLFEKKPSSMTISQALEIAEQAESARAAKTLSSQVVVKEEPIYRAAFEGGRQRRFGGSRGGVTGGGGAGTAQGAHGSAGGQVRSCAVCGMKSHSEATCRFRSYKCDRCGKKGHLKKVCGDKWKYSRVNNIAGDDSGVTDHGESVCEECQNYNISQNNSDNNIPVTLDVSLDNCTGSSLDNEGGNRDEIQPNSSDPQNVNVDEFVDCTDECEREIREGVTNAQLVSPAILAADEAEPPDQHMQPLLETREGLGCDEAVHFCNERELTKRRECCCARATAA